ncbi:MAG: hypothetical protein JWP61_1733 [Friedmanniella sp.]|nr:hypothetical protein [Friedmanniella sp.]
MATRDTAFAPGTPCWVDLFTSDPEKAQAFYGAVFGWEFENSGEEFGGYLLARSGGHQVAGAMKNDGANGTPDGWTTYLATADVDAHVAAATAAGAVVVAPAMQVGPLGSMAVLVDPAGGAFGLWQAAAHTGFTKYNEAGSVTWNENHSKDYAASKAFYAQVFGWDYEVTSDTDEFRYVTAKVAGEPVAGLMDSASFLPADVPTHWAVYFSVDDVDAAVQAVRDHGGTVLMGPEDSPFGRIADVLDPTGAAFKLHGGFPTGAADADAEPAGAASV